MSVPAAVSIAFPASGATFPVTVPAGAAPGVVTITASRDGQTVNTTFTVTDTVAITTAIYRPAKQQLQVAATSTSAGATLQVYANDGTNRLIDILTNADGGKYQGRFSWPPRPARDDLAGWWSRRRGYHGAPAAPYRRR